MVTAGDGQEGGGGGGVGGDGVSCMGYEATIPRYSQWQCYVRFNISLSNFLVGTDQGRVMTARIQSKQGASSLLLGSWQVGRRT